MKKIRAFKLFMLMVFAALTASARHYTVVISLRVVQYTLF